jgi:hypothetical protein
MLASLVMVALAAGPKASPTVDDYLGRWNVRILDAADTFTSGWFEVRRQDGRLGGELVWRWGSVVPAKSVKVVEGVLRLVREEGGKDETFEARVDGEQLRGSVRYADGTIHNFEGRRAPELARSAPPRWGAPVTLFDGKSLDGWRLRDAKAKNGWTVKEGTLAVADPAGNSDLVSTREFTDFKLHVEYNVEPHSNSGVYLRGRDEIQILDDPEKATESTGNGALYSRIAPARNASKPAGEWQRLDVTLVGRRLTVVLNDRTIIEDGHVDGITGGALDPFEGDPGPLMLQGDHGKVAFRNIVVIPAE